MEDDQYCPHCKTSKYRNPFLKLYVNLCGHALCDNCVELLFLKGVGQCTQCGLTLRKSNFRLRLFEDDLVEKELDIRRKVMKDFNKKQDDFGSMKEYDDYLEQIETIIYNLTYNVDVEQTKQLIEQYRKDNADSISKNRGKLDPDEAILDQLIEQEKERDEMKKKMDTQQDESVQLARLKKLQKEQLVDELMYSDLPANQILQTHNSEQNKLAEQHRLLAERNQQQQLQQQHSIRANQPSFFSTGIQLGRAGNIFAPVPKDESKPFVYVATEIPLNGPHCPGLDEVEEEGYLFHVRQLEPSERAGGFLAAYSCVRALQEAFCGLYFRTELK